MAVRRASGFPLAAKDQDLIFKHVFSFATTPGLQSPARHLGLSNFDRNQSQLQFFCRNIIPVMKSNRSGYGCRWPLIGEEAVGGKAAGVLVRLVLRGSRVSTEVGDQTKGGGRSGLQIGRENTEVWLGAKCQEERTIPLIRPDKRYSSHQN